MFNQLAPVWQPPARLDRRHYPSVQMFLPPASGQNSVTRILKRIAPPQYTLHAPEAAAWFAGRSGADEPAAALETHGAIYHWWCNTALLERSIMATPLNARELPYVLILRDPRDSLVSLYHLSLDPRHAPAPSSARYTSYMAERDHAVALGLDAYVQSVAASWIGGLESIANFIDRYSPTAVCFVSYALLCHDFPLFLDRLTRFARIEPPTVLRDELLLTEDVRRSDTLTPASLTRLEQAAPMPGRHRRELRADTIHLLNARSKDLRMWMRRREIPALQSCYDD